MSARDLDGGTDPAGAATVSGAIAFTVNGRSVSVTAPPLRRLADALRDDLGLTGTKVGCNAGDCGACTVLLDGAQVCSCMVPLAQAAGRSVETVEGLAQNGRLNRLQRAFLRHGAAQCGACTPGMLIAATELLRACPRPRPAEVMDGLGGVLCRCTGYRKIVAAVLDAAGDAPQPLSTPPPGAAVGARLAKLDGVPKLTGAERYGADAVPAGALWLRVIRSPHESARVVFGDIAAAAGAWPGVARVLTAADVPSNRIGIYPDLRDQPVLAEEVVRYRGDPVVALVGTREAIVAVRDEDLPIRYEPLPGVRGLGEAQATGAPLVHDDMEDNRLIEGGVERGDAEAALAGSAVTAEGRFETAFVEHAYIEPEAGWARRVGDRVELWVSTQTPVMDREMTAEVLGLAPSQVRIVPSACGGGFGGKLDVSIQPLTALAAWLTGAPVACVYERPESMMASTKRHPAAIEARFGCDGDGKLQAVAFDATFDTGAYASWGPTVAGRVPVHATGPYAVPTVSARGRAIYTNGPPAGAFRGFGVPQAAIAHEALMDDLAARLGMDRLELRLKNALRVGDATATGQVLEASAGLAPAWRRSSRAGSVRSKTPPGPTRKTGRSGAASASAACGTASATPRSATRPPCGSRSTARGGSRSTTAPSTSAKARPRSSRRSARTHWVWRRTGSPRSSATRTGPRTRARPRPRARLSSRARRPSAPALPCAPRFCARPMSPTTPPSSLRALRFWSATAGAGWRSTLAGSRRMSGALCWKAPAPSTRRPRRSTPRARARPTPPTPSAPRSLWSMSTPNSGP